MQDTCFEVSRTTNADVQRKLKNKYDTRAAAAVENITKQGAVQCSAVHYRDVIEDPQHPSLLC